MLSLLSWFKVHPSALRASPARTDAIESAFLRILRNDHDRRCGRFSPLLARILELLRDSEFLAHVSGEVVLGKLRYGKWGNWPEEEQQAVREHLHCLWRLVLQIPPPDNPYEPAEIGFWLCAVARAERDLSPLSGCIASGRITSGGGQSRSFRG